MANGIVRIEIGPGAAPLRSGVDARRVNTSGQWRLCVDDVESEASALDQSREELFADRCGWRPDATGSFGALFNKAQSRLGDDFRRGAVAGILISCHANAELSSVGMAHQGIRAVNVLGVNRCHEKGRDPSARDRILIDLIACWLLGALESGAQ